MGHALCQSFVPLDGPGVSALSSVMQFRFRRMVLTGAALLSAMSLTSCLDNYKEEMIIHSDLSGEATVTIVLPDTLLDKYEPVQKELSEASLRKRFDKASGVKLESYEITDGRNPELTLRVSFSSLDKLSAAAKDNAPAQMLIGQFTISKENNYTVVQRQLGTGTPTMPLPNDKYVNYKMHFDMPVEVAHTDSGFFDKSNGDVRYRWSLAELNALKPTLVNKVIKPLPWLWIGISVVTLIVLAWYVWQAMQKAARAKAMAARYAPPPATSLPPVQPPGGPPAGPQRPGPPRRPGPPGR